MGRSSWSIAAVVVGAVSLGTGCTRPNAQAAPKLKTIEAFFGIDPFTTEQALGWKDCQGGGPHVPLGPPHLRICGRNDKEKDESYKVKFVIDDRFPQYKGRLHSIEVELRHLLYGGESRTDAYMKALDEKYGPLISVDGRGSGSEVQACRPGSKDCIEHALIVMVPGRFGPSITLIDDTLDTAMNKAIDAEQRADGERAAQGQ